MAPAGGFSVTPGHYNAQYDYEFRQRRERVSYAEVSRNALGHPVTSSIDEIYRKGQRYQLVVIFSWGSTLFRLRPTGAESRGGSTTRTRASPNHHENLDVMPLN